MELDVTNTKAALASGCEWAQTLYHNRKTGVEVMVCGGASGAPFVIKCVPFQTETERQTVAANGEAERARERRRARRKANFYREAGIAERVRHPNIVAFYGAHETLGWGELWMEHVDCTVEGLVSPGNGLYSWDPTAVLHGLLLALRYLHAQGIIHRDVASKNVGITAGGDVKLLDFGLACYKRGLSRSRLAVSGTPLYMAPEVMAAEPYDELVDVWSAGVMWHYMLCGAYPFRADTYENLRRVVTGYDYSGVEMVLDGNAFNAFACMCVTADTRLSAGDMLHHALFHSPFMQTRIALPGPGTAPAAVMMGPSVCV